MTKRFGGPALLALCVLAGTPVRPPEGIKNLCDLRILPGVPGAAALEIPRVNGSELSVSPRLQSGRHPFILTKGMEEWAALGKFSSLDWFKETFPKAIVDYYPENLADVHRKPFLRPMQEVLTEFAREQEPPPVGWGQTGKSSSSRYIHWRMTAREWGAVRHLLKPQHPFFTTDQAWLHKCLPKKIRRPRDGKVNWPVNNWIKHTHWKIIVIGEQDSGMFFHADGFSTSTFVAQFVGRKRWKICTPASHDVMYRAGDVDTFFPDYESYPNFRAADCADVVVHPGEVVYYPSHFWHQTLNLDRPCVSMAGRRIDENNMHEVYSELKHRCKHPGPDITKQWPGAAPNLSKRNCKAIKKCFKMWKDIFARDVSDSHGEL